MKHIVKVNNIQDAKDSAIRPIIALDNRGILFFEGAKVVPEGFVDLGLPSGTLWSKYNLGVNPEDLSTAESWYGNYYAGGELEEKAGWDGQGTKVLYDWPTYKYANGSERKLTKYCNNSNYGNNGFTDNLTQLVPEDDVATVTNSAWRMPTEAELEELVALPNEWVDNYNGISGLNGRVFTGKNGNTLFIPAASYRDGSDIYDVGSSCFLWSSSLTLGYPYCACYLYFDSDSIYMDDCHRCCGLSVRPVC